jgi:hypothetical protein
LDMSGKPNILKDVSTTDTIIYINQYN